MPAARAAPDAGDRDDLEAAARALRETLPEPLDLVHLGLGPDGHTASLVPGDPVLEVTDRRVALTGRVPGAAPDDPHLPGARRGRARSSGWSPARTSATPLAKLLAGDASIPAGRVEAARQTIVCDRGGRAGQS